MGHVFHEKKVEKAPATLQSAKLLLRQDVLYDADEGFYNLCSFTTYNMTIFKSFMEQFVRSGW